MTQTYPCRWVDHGDNSGHFEPADPNIKPIPYSGADETPPVFGRRWKLARDGFGLQRDDAEGNYVHIDDALSVMHQAIAAAVADESEGCAMLCDEVVNPEPEYDQMGYRKEDTASTLAASIRAR